MNHSHYPNRFKPLLWLFSPLVPFYYLLIWIKNFFYDHQLFTSYVAPIPVISIGNLALGGTGKTPCIAYLVELLQKDHRIAVLSRGYKRHTKGYRLASDHDRAATIGDEPYQLYSKFTQQQLHIPIAVCENRTKGIRNLLSTHPTISLILLDDAFQHRQVQPNLNMLLTTFEQPFFKDHLFPWGHLREYRSAAHRASMIVVTKCPSHLHKTQETYLRKGITLYCNKDIPIFFSHLVYKKPISFWDDDQTLSVDRAIVLLTGIADPTEMFKYVSKKYKVAHKMTFPDHHAFTKKDILKILKCFDKVSYKKKCILTTEKDMARLVTSSWLNLLQKTPLFFLPLSMQINQDEGKFVKHILSYIKKH